MPVETAVGQPGFLHDLGDGQAELTKPLAHPDITDPGQLAGAPGWTLHDPRHSALPVSENGASTGTLLAYSGHSSVASLARYSRVSPDALTRWQARRDLHRGH